MVDAIKQKIQSPGWLTVVVLVITLAIGFSEWVSVGGLQTYGEILSLQNTASLVKYLGPTAIAAIMKGFIK